jgi:membrane dipeptidase
VELAVLGAPVIDVHGHTLDLAFKTGRDLHQGLGGLTDVPLMRAGGVAAQLTACWVPDAAIGGPHGSRQPLREVLRIADYLHRQLEGEAGEQVVLATRAEHIEAAQRSGKTAFVLGLEGGDAIMGDLSVLRTLYRLGVRHLGPVHEGRNALGTATQVWDGPQMRLYDPEIDPPGRLTEEGKQVISEMNRLGMLVDITHMVEACFWDALEIARAPVVATHGNARALRDTVRYMNDEQIRAVAATGGLVCPSPMPLGPGGETASLELLLDHIDYMVALVGADYVGLGTDLLDQVNARPAGLRDIGESPNIVRGLQQRGHTAEAINGIMGGNFIRVFRQVAG